MIRLSLALAALLVPTIPVLASDFPQTFEHRYGTTVIEQKPLRVVSLGYAEADNILALGVAPLTVRASGAAGPKGVAPWAEAAFGDAVPLVITGDIDIEAIAALQPDLILATNAGLSADQYELFSQIAPVIENRTIDGEFLAPWDQRARVAGLALGLAEDAETLIAALNSRTAEIAASHPDWAGKTATVAASFAPGEVTSFAASDSRLLLVKAMGLVPPPNAPATPAGQHYVTISAEDLRPLDADLLVWLTLADSGAAAIEALVARQELTAYSEGHEVISGPLVSAAFSYATLLSLNYALDHLVPAMELALDGETDAAVPTTP